MSNAATEFLLPGLGPVKDIHDWISLVPESPWLVSGLIAAESLNLITAKREVGKSLLVCDFLSSYLMGEPEWLGRKFEQDSRGRAMFMVTDANAEAEVSRQLTALGVPRGYVDLARHSGEMYAANAGDWAHWGENLRTHRDTRILVVDNGTGMSAGVVDTEATSRLFKALRVVTGPMGLTVILIHHEKNTGGTAGNYQWQSESRHRLSLAMGDSSDYRELSFQGGNTMLPEDMPEVIPLRMPRKSHPGSRFTLTDARNTVPEDRSATAHKNQERIDELVAMNRSDWSSQEELGQAVGLSQPQMGRVMRKAGYVLVGGSLVRKSLFIHFPP